MEVPPTRYARSGDLAIAYQVHGDGDHDLVFSGSTASNVETAWRFPEAHRLFERLGRFARVIRFDRRDTGLSDSAWSDLTLEAHAADALAVMDAVGAERPVLLGGLEGARSLALLAATRPSRARGLIAISPSVRGPAAANPEVAADVRATLVGLDWPGATLAFTAPGWLEDPVRRDRLIRYIQSVATPGQARRLLELSMTSDVSAVLPLVQAPTLVLDAVGVPLAPGSVREFADLIPGAEHVEIGGDAIILYALDVDEVADAIERFVTGATGSPPTSRVLATVVFTDLVASTAHAADAGDARWARILEQHHAASRLTVEAHGGELVKLMGDGVLALFAGPAQAVRCARRLAGDAQAQGLRQRAGVHTGEVERLGGDVAGIAVHLAARIMALAAPDEVLVSRTVRDLVIGSELTFEDRGAHELAGLPEPWTVFAADAPAGHAAP